MSALRRLNDVERHEGVFVKHLVAFNRAGGTVFSALCALGISFRRKEVATYLLDNQRGEVVRMVVNPVTDLVVQVLIEHQSDRWDVRVYLDSAFAFAIEWQHGSINSKQPLDSMCDYRKLAQLNAGLSRVLNRWLASGYAIPVVH